MSVPMRLRFLVFAATAIPALLPVPTWAQGPAAASTGITPNDGRRDFDFLVGSWKIHLRRLVKPLTGSRQWLEFDGRVVCRKIWDGRGELEQFDVDSPEEHIVIHGLTVRLYDPQTRQWHIYWSNAERGIIEWPPVEGHFTNGRGDFYDEETFEGKPIIVRYTWTRTDTSSPHFEQSYSADWGKTWEVNWMTDQTKN